MKNRKSLFTIGLSEIRVGNASESGEMPSEMNKIGKTYKDTCKLAQDSPEATEHFEEGKASPAVRNKQLKIPKLTFSIMDANVQDLIDYVGGSNVGTDAKPEWGFDGTEVVANRAIQVISQQGLIFNIPNGDIEAVINGDMSSKGIFLVDFTVTPMDVTKGKALRALPKEDADTKDEAQGDNKAENAGDDDAE